MARQTERNPSLYQQLESLPDGLIGEIINGQLRTQPRPAWPHSLAGSRLGADIEGPYGRGRGGPGGWWIIDEPEVHVILDTEITVPDIAGWRKERMPSPPEGYEKLFGVQPLDNRLGPLGIGNGELLGMVAQLNPHGLGPSEIIKQSDLVITEVTCHGARLTDIRYGPNDNDAIKAGNDAGQSILTALEERVHCGYPWSVLLTIKNKPVARGSLPPAQPLRRHAGILATTFSVYWVTRFQELFPLHLTAVAGTP